MNLKWKIVLVNYPFDESDQSKMRPALCLNDPVGPYAHVIVGYFTSQQPDALEASDIVVDPSLKQWNGTNLKKTSVLRLHRLFTTDALLMRSTLGVWPQAERAEVESRVRALLDL